MNTAAQSLSKAAERITALVTSKLRGADIHSEMARLAALPRSRARLEIGVVLAALFGLAVFAASLGWVAMAAYFLLVIYIGR
ncbi:MAG: hypothetical protein AAFW64_00800 [Pseudomonadota bacterium]